MRLSIASPAFVAALALLLVVDLGATVRARRRRWRLALAATATTLVLACTAAAVNAYYDYVPTLDALLGRVAADQASPSQLVQAAALSQPPAHGLVEQVVIPPLVSGFHARPAEAYLPPVWFTPARPPLPVIELLHGTPGTPQDWTRGGGADVSADRWAAAHGGLAPIIVMPDVNGSFSGDSECVDGRLGRAETYLSVDVPAWAVGRLQARADRQGWAVGGLSEGGYCALDLALRHRDRYGAFLDFGGLDGPTRTGGVSRLFATRSQLRAHQPFRLLARLPPGPRPAGWFEVGGDDGGVTRAVLAMAGAARRAGLESQLTVLPHAHHTFRLWRRSFADALPWVAAHLGLGNPPTATGGGS